MRALERIVVSANREEEEQTPVTEREHTAALRREVGRCARTAWDALQHTLTSFARAKMDATDRLYFDTAHACDLALSELDRLQRALRSLRAELTSMHVVSARRHSFLDAVVGARASAPGVSLPRG